jgi:hypothetical protein
MANSFARRLIGLIRRQCVDHLVVFGEQTKDRPQYRPVQRIGGIVPRVLIGGLHHPHVKTQLEVLPRS